ncbi:MAG: hydantoinase/oxoprolinase family protein [Candidatus Tectomicrobia bacterium]
MLEIAVDIGGTFTDAVGWDGSAIYTAKVASTPGNLTAGVRASVEQILRLSGCTPSEISRFVHGTTIATNAVLEQKGARIGLLMTAGFKDVLEIGRQKRSRMYDLFMDPETPTFLAPRRLRVDITERIDAKGTIVVPLDEPEVRTKVANLLQEYDIQAVAVCYLFAFRNSTHEQRTRDIIRAYFPELHVSLSSEVDPVFREYERTCVTAFDAYVRPVVASYLRQLADSLETMQIQASLQIMQSRGGIASVQGAIARPVSTLLSGPAAGALGGKVAGERSHLHDLITLDIGGTSCDISLLRNGHLGTSREGRLGGYPLRIPMVDVTTIGAGGGSIAWVDEAGGLRIGPHSAGAEPGPACYKRGGSEPTITDASLILGYLNPERFAANLQLDRHAAERALATIARPLDMDLVSAAQGMHTVVNATMADGIRMVSVHRGYDPREFALVLLGGAGPIHGGALAPALGIDTLLVPERPGVLSAFGLLAADIEYDTYRTFDRQADDVDVQEMLEVFEELDTLGQDTLRRDGIALERVQVRRFADMRYVGQSYDLEIPLATQLDADALRRAVDAFYNKYRQVYGHGSFEEAAEFVNLRTVHVCPVQKPTQATRPRRGSLTQALKGSRRAYFGAPEGFVETPVYDRTALPEGEQFRGPAIIEQDDTTTIVYPWQVCEVDTASNMIMRLEET